MVPIRIAAACLFTLPLTPAMAQDQGQLCVNQCLFNHGPASNPAYHACVAQMCEEQAPLAAPETSGRWTTHRTANGGGHSAAIENGAMSFNFICQRGGPALIGIAGLGQSGAVILQIDNQQFRPPVVAQNGVLYTAAEPGSVLVRALLGGSSLRVEAGGQQTAFSLAGSGAAIRSALAGCGLRP